LYTVPHFYVTSNVHTVSLRVLLSVNLYNLAPAAGNEHLDDRRKGGSVANGTRQPIEMDQ
jgi:hypothetical protein